MAVIPWPRLRILRPAVRCSALISARGRIAPNFGLRMYSQFAGRLPSFLGLLKRLLIINWEYLLRAQPGGDRIETKIRLRQDFTLNVLVNEKGKQLRST